MSGNSDISFTDVDYFLVKYTTPFFQLLRIADCDPGSNKYGLGDDKKTFIYIYMVLLFSHTVTFLERMFISYRLHLLPKLPMSI